MKVVVLANLRWYMHSPSQYRLACPPGHQLELLYVGREDNLSGWFLTDGTTHVRVPDRDTGAMMLAKQLNGCAGAERGTD